MCILIAKKAGVKTPSKKTLENCFKANPDGAGYAYINGKKMYLNKGFMTFADFWRSFRAVDVTEKDCIIHFRIATHGTVCVDNCHPFAINGQICAAHNGVLSIPSKNNKTDSEIFFTEICAPLIENFGIESPLFKEVIRLSIGTSKIAFLDIDSGLHTFGHFIESGGVLFSNRSFESVPEYKFQSGRWDFKAKRFMPYENTDKKPGGYVPLRYRWPDETHF